MAKVTLKNVYKVYDGDSSGAVTAVNDFNLEVNDREFVVFVGPSGCGKSTTLRMLAGLEEISAGDVCIDGKRVNDMPPKDRDIAMVFQNYALYPHMSVFDNMAFGLKLQKAPKNLIQKRVQEAAAILGIEDYLKRKPKALSGGQRQRVALGRAIVRNPKVFLFDEPLSNLDAKMRIQMRAEIIKLHRQLQSTMIYVTHDQVEAMTMGDRIVAMKDGIIQQVDTPLALYDRPVNLFVAGFLGSPPMNFIKGTIEVTGANPTFCVVGGDFSCDLSDYEEARAYHGKEVILGIRPEDLMLSSSNRSSSAYRFEAEVDFVEPMGAETNIYIKAANHDLICRSNEHLGHDKAGTKMFFDLDLSMIHLFDCETEARIENQQRLIR